jgi:hypothetical protein
VDAGVFGLGATGHLEEAAQTATGDRAHGSGGSYRLRPGWPTMESLRYVETLVGTALLVLGLMLVAGKSLQAPERGLAELGKAAKRKAGAA